jgi:hypothetical protein
VIGLRLTLEGQPMQGVMVARESARTVPAIKTSEAAANETILNVELNIGRNESSRWKEKECTSN